MRNSRDPLLGAGQGKSSGSRSPVAAEAKLVLPLAKLWEKLVVAKNPSPPEFTCQILQVFLSFPAQPEGK